MSNAANLLFEIGCEEIPARFVMRILKDLEALMKAHLEKSGFSLENTQSFATPRRLAIMVNNLSDTQNTQNIYRRGPSVEKAFDKNGNPTLAAMGFARSCGANIEELTREKSEQGEWLVYQKEKPGEPLHVILPILLETLMNELPLPKRMRWGMGEFSFIRPVQWILLLHGSKTIPATLFGKESSNLTYGHQFHHPDPIKLARAEDYLPQLKKAFVIADVKQRRALIESQIHTLAGDNKASAVIDPTLLNEVTQLVEWPHALLGRFDKAFLNVPEEALISAMYDHQKCFHCIDNDGKLQPMFIAVSNIDSKQSEAVIKGNEWVIQARLSDAAFFYETDCKESLEKRLETLKHITYQKQLGTMHQKVERITQLAEAIARHLDEDKKKAKRTAQLAKCDLATKMVYEFPELQGIMGRYYALNDGEDATVAEAIEDHYHPRFAKDTLPRNAIGNIIALADRIDTLVGIFGIKKKPTGDKDPFGLRRSALGIVRILIENNLHLNLSDLIQASIHAYHKLPQDKDTIKNDVHRYILERLAGYYQEKDTNIHLINAVMDQQFDNIADFSARLDAVKLFVTLPESSALASANRRVNNILKKELTNGKIPKHLKHNLLQEEAEINLAKLIENKHKEIKPLQTEGEYAELLKTLAELQGPVDIFFENVMVMHDDEKIKANRLALLYHLRELFLQVADISKLPAQE